MTRVAITGASGHVGANLIRLLIERGYDVCAVVHGDTRGVDGLKCTRVSGSVLDPLSLCDAFKGAEYVFHLAAVITLTRDRNGIVWRTNVEGTKNVVDACVTCGVRRLIQCSSIHAFSAYPLDELVTESRALATEPNLPDYDRSKVGGELEALKGIEHGLEVVIINPTAVVGPHDFKPSRMGE